MIYIKELRGGSFFVPLWGVGRGLGRWLLSGFQNEEVGKVLLVLGMGNSGAIIAIFLWL